MSFGGARYAIHFTDMASRFSKVYVMERKDQAGEKLLEFLLFCSENGVKVKCIQTDGAKEYIEPVLDISYTRIYLYTRI